MEKTGEKLRKFSFTYENKSILGTWQLYTKSFPCSNLIFSLFNIYMVIRTIRNCGSNLTVLFQVKHFSFHEYPYELKFTVIMLTRGWVVWIPVYIYDTDYIFESMQNVMIQGGKRFKSTSSLHRKCAKNCDLNLLLVWFGTLRLAFFLRLEEASAIGTRFSDKWEISRSAPGFSLNQ